MDSPFEEKYAFDPPTSIREAKSRIRKLTISIMNIEKKLGDRKRDSGPEYNTWRSKATSARIYMVSEKAGLEAWVAERRQEMLGGEVGITKLDDPREILRAALRESRKCLRGEKHNLPRVLSVIDTYLNHVG